jgi:threonine synthase
VKVARENLTPGVPMVVLETAWPAKFSATLVEALGHEPQRPAALADLERRPRRVQAMDADAEAVKRYIARHAT